MRLKVLMGCALLCACAKEAPLNSYTLTFAVTADNGDALENVVITGNGKELGKTALDGKLTYVARSKEGVRVRVKATCPEGYRPSDDERVVPLRSYKSLDKSRPAELFSAFECHPTKRMIAVIVRADGRAGLPVLRQGYELAKTNRYGIAHLMLELEPHQNIELMLSTDSNKRLRPPNPKRTFRVPDEDSVNIWDPKFETKRGPRKSRPKIRGPREVKNNDNRYGL